MSLRTEDKWERVTVVGELQRLGLYMDVQETTEPPERRINKKEQQKPLKLWE